MYAGVIYVHALVFCMVLYYTGIAYLHSSHIPFHLQFNSLLEFLLTFVGHTCELLPAVNVYER